MSSERVKYACAIAGCTNTHTGPHNSNVRPLCTAHGDTMERPSERAMRLAAANAYSPDCNRTAAATADHEREHELSATHVPCLRCGKPISVCPVYPADGSRSFICPGPGDSDGRDPDPSKGHAPLRAAIKRTRANIEREREILAAQERQLADALGPRRWSLEVALQVAQEAHRHALWAESKVREATAELAKEQS